MFKTAARHIEAVVLPRMRFEPPPVMPSFIAPAVKPAALPKRRRALPAVWMRAGTSKGLYLHRQDLPANQDDWASVITRVMGSYDGDVKQLNGIGGATSTTSKVAVIAASKRPGIDVDYTFVQVPLGGASLEMSGNCGNIASGVGPFAVDEGLVALKPGQGQVKVRIFNTNTNSVMVETVQVDDEGHFLEDGECVLPGLCSTGSRVQMAFAKPAGSMTGKLLPTGSPTDVLLVQRTPSSPPIPVQVSMVDAANPFAFVDGRTFPSFFLEQGPAAPESINFIELVRRHAAVAMGLACSVKEAAHTRGTPKIAIVTVPEDSTDASAPDVQCVAYSMGKVHGSLQLTGAVCLATASCTEGTVAHAIRSRSVSRSSGVKTSPSSTPNLILRHQQVKLRHPGGDMEVDVRVSASGQAEEVGVLRTARRLFEGTVYYLQ